MATALGTKLAAARQERGWSLRRVEADTGIRNAHLSQIETGAIERPEPGILWTLAEAYGLDFDELMRLAGHVQAREEHRPSGPGAAVAWRALTALSPDEQREVLEFMAKLRRRPADERGGPG